MGEGKDKEMFLKEYRPGRFMKFTRTRRGGGIKRLIKKDEHGDYHWESAVASRSMSATPWQYHKIITNDEAEKLLGKDEYHKFFEKTEDLVKEAIKEQEEEEKRAAAEAQEAKEALEIKLRQEEQERAKEEQQRAQNQREDAKHLRRWLAKKTANDRETNAREAKDAKDRETNAQEAKDESQ